MIERFWAKAEGLGEYYKVISEEDYEALLTQAKELRELLIEVSKQNRGWEYDWDVDLSRRVAQKVLRILPE